MLSGKVVYYLYPYWEIVASKRTNNDTPHLLLQTSFVLGERAIMSELDHPFLMSLVTAFQDDYSLYMLLAICDGGELYSVMSKAEGRRLSQRSARFYTACILDGLAYLHSKNICHRDLKAENVMLDKDGYCVLIDFGFGTLVEISFLRQLSYLDHVLYSP